MKRFILFITLLGIFFTESFGKNPDQDIIILYTNDVHCAIETTDSIIGYPGLLSYREEMVKNNTPYVTLVDAGDHAQGAAIGSISKGEYIIDILNKINYDVVVPGNHEFDYGMEQFIEFGNNLETGYVCSNFRNLKTGELVFKPYKLITYGDVKVAYVGITTPESITKSVPTYFMDENGDYIYDFDGDETGEKFYSTIQKAIDDAKKEGADFVVGVGHLGESEDITPAWSAQSVVAHTSGFDVFIDGHSHQVQEGLKQKTLDGKEILITQSGTQLSYIGKVTIKANGEITTELVGRDQITSKDESLAEYIESIKAKFEAELKVVVSHVSFDLNISDKDGNRLIRKQETNLANLVSDAFLKISQKYGHKVDISFSNGGSIRTTIKAGDITIGNIRDVLPFNNELCIVEVPGQTLLDALEFSASKYPGENGGFLHPAGLTYAIDPDVETSIATDEKNIFIGVTGARRVHSVLVNGVAIDPEKKYMVTGDNYFLIQNGDGYVFNNTVIINRSYGLPSDIAAEYIKGLSEEEMNQYKEPQGRIVFSKVSSVGDTNLNSEGTSEEKPASTEQQGDKSTEQQGEKTTEQQGDKSTGQSDKATTDDSSSAVSLKISRRLTGLIFIATFIFYCFM